MINSLRVKVDLVIAQCGIAAAYYLDIDKGLINDCLKTSKVFNVQHAQDSGCYVCFLICNIPERFMSCHASLRHLSEDRGGHQPSMVDLQQYA